jgi:hypothetical protein
MLVSSILLGKRTSIAGSWITYLPGALQVPLSLSITGAIVPTALGLSLSDDGGAEPPYKRANSWSFLPASTRHVCGAEFRGMPFPLPPFWILGFEGSVGLNDRSCTILVPVVHRQSTVAVALATEVPGIGDAPQGVIGTEVSGASIHGSLGAMSVELPGPYLPDSSDCASPPINWRQVESEVELACSHVATVEQLLHHTLGSVHHNIIHPV